MDIDKNADMPDTSSLASKGKVKEDVSLTANASVKNPETATPASTTTPKPIVHLTKREEEFMRKDKNLAEFLPMLDDLEPLIPDSVTDYYLARSGFAADDIRIKRLMSLAAQKFIADIVTDAFQYCKIRQQNKKNITKRNKTVLNLEELAAALSEYGINIKKPDYYRA